MKNVFKTLLLISLITPLGAHALNGTFTVGGLSADFVDFNDALTAIESKVIDGPITLEVLSGTYTESIIMNQQFTYSPQVWPIKIKSQSGNRADVILRPTSTAIINVIEQEQIIFQSMTLESNGSAWSNVIINSAANITLENMQIESDFATTYGVYVLNTTRATLEGVIFDGNGGGNIAINDQGSDLCDYSELTISGYDQNSVSFNNSANSQLRDATIDGGNAATAGVSTFNTNNLEIHGVSLANHRTYGLFSRDDRELNFHNNTITNGPTSSNALTGIFNSTPKGRIILNANYINISHDEVNNGIVSSRSGLRGNFEVIITNNMVTVGGGANNDFGISVGGQISRVKVFNNSAHVRSGGSNVFNAAFSLNANQGANDLRIQNNVFTNYKGGYAYYFFNPNNESYFSRLNDLYTSGGGKFAFYNNDVADLDALYAAGGQNINSISVDPGYVSETDLHVSNHFLHIGNLVPEATFDIDGQPRGDGVVTLGADELYQNFEVDAGFETTVFLGYAPAECTDLTAIPSNGTAPYTYEWINGETTQTINVCPTTTRKYYVVAQDANGDYATGIVIVNVVDVRCGSSGSGIQVCTPGGQATACVGAAAVPNILAAGGSLGECGVFYPKQVLGLEKQELTSPMRVYPNPFENSFQVNVGQHNDAPALEVLDLTGKLVRTVALNNKANQVQVNAADLPAGVYFIRIGTATKKLIKY